MGLTGVENTGGSNLTVKVSVNRFVLLRIERTRKEVETSTQRLRNKTLKNLGEIFATASRVVNGQIKQQRINRRMVPITLTQRRRWLLVAGHTAQTMKKIADNFDEQEIKLQLDKLEKLIKEATSTETTRQDTRKSS